MIPNALMAAPRAGPRNDALADYRRWESTSIPRVRATKRRRPLARLWGMLAARRAAAPLPDAQVVRHVRPPS